jgi:hypothetical protein
MEHIDVQGKGNKVAATQGKITAQNPTNQSHKNNNTDKLFRSIGVEEFEKSLSKFDFGIVKPDFIVRSLQMSERIINGARIPEDKKGVLRCSFSLLMAAVASPDI